MGTDANDSQAITPVQAKGAGGLSASHWDTGREHIRENLRIWRQALSKWPERIPADMLVDIAEAINRHLKSGDDRVEASAIRSGMELMQYRLKLLETLDKMDRLDSGEYTENVRQAVRIIIE